VKRFFSARRVIRGIFFTFVASTVFTVIRIILAPTIAPVTDIDIRVKGDYLLMLIHCVLGAAAMLFPAYLSRKADLDIPTGMMIVYAVFLYCAIYLGEVRNFYYRIPYWDTILHTFSGAAIGALGFSIVSLLNQSDNLTFSLSPIFVSLFAFCFALSLGMVWEIYEYSIDYFLRTNMQRYALESGELLMGQAALMDTMKDLMVDAIGAFAMSVVGYISLKHDKGWLDRLHVKVNAD
jgi:hypothetical protein